MIPAEWEVLNRERGDLIDACIEAGGLNKQQAARLEELNAIADRHIDEVAPRSTEVLDKLEEIIRDAVPCPDCDTGWPEGRMCVTCRGTSKLVE
jgi:hypothetical protein